MFYLHSRALLLLQEIHYGLNFSSDNGDDEFGIFSVKFSTDGRELVAGTSDCSICVYDLGADKLSLRIPAHQVLYIICYNLYFWIINKKVSNILGYLLKVGWLLKIRIKAEIQFRYVDLNLSKPNLVVHYGSN